MKSFTNSQLTIQSTTLQSGVGRYPSTDLMTRYLNILAMKGTTLSKECCAVLASRRWRVVGTNIMRLGNPVAASDEQGRGRFVLYIKTIPVRLEEIF